MINRLKKHLSGISKKEFVFIGIFSIMLVFNYFLFGQFEVLFNNSAEFGVAIREVIWMFVWRALLILLAVVLILIILRGFSKTAFSYTVAILFGLILAGYVQVLFLNKSELLKIDGTPMNISALKLVSNLLIYIFIVLIPPTFLIIERKTKKSFTSKLAYALCLVVFGMQTVGIITTGASVVRPTENNELYYFSVDEQLKLSKNNNIIVFVMDRLDSSIVEAIPETKDVFSGFTYYNNNISEYPSTFPSVASMLTSKTYDKETGNKIVDYLQDAWKDEILLSALKEKGYIVNGLMDTTATIFDFKDLDGKFDNIRQVDKKNRTIKGNRFFKALTNYAMMRQSSYALKKMFSNSKYLKLQNYCVQINNTADYFDRMISASSDLRFYDKLTAYSDIQRRLALTAEEERKVFSFVHLQSAHNPFLYNENLEIIKGKNSEKNQPVSQTRGSFKILAEYFRQMEELKIYKDSTIIVLGDHGSWNHKDNLANPPRTALLVKESGKTYTEPYQIDKDMAELSHSNFAPTILELIGYEQGEDENNPRLGPTYFDVIKGDDKIQQRFSTVTGKGKQTRYFYYVNWTNLYASYYVCGYEIKGDAGNGENWRKL